MQLEQILRAGLLGTLLIAFSGAGAATSTPHMSGKLRAPQPAPACVAAAFSSVVTSGWASESLKVTNQCTVAVDFQNSLITFNNKTALNTGFWGSFAPLSFPVGALQITSQAATAGGYTASIALTFPVQSWAITKLQPGQSFTIQYGETSPGYDPASVKIWLGSTVSAGEIDLSSTTAQPPGVSAGFAVVNLVSGGVTSKIQVPWQGMKAVTGLAAGTYGIQPETVQDAQGNIYTGVATPASLTLSAGQKVTSVISYTPLTAFGAINVQTPALPAALSGYTKTPVVTLTRPDTGASLVQTLPWQAVSKVSQLASNVSYTFSTPVISYNNVNCTGSFSPASLLSSAASPATTTLSYNCVPVILDSVTLNVAGLPATVSTVTVILTPGDGSAPVSQVVSLSGGIGSAKVSLADGVAYNVAATSVAGYDVAFAPQPVVARAGATASITYQQQTVKSGRIMTYIPGWKTPPAATELAAAGYTNALIAFGVFSTSQPGQIVSAFDTVSANYISQLQAAGIRVSLSLGGASSSIPGTTVDFHKALSLASSPAAFEQAFVSSVEAMVRNYHFDGIDIDIEFGLNPAGTFTAPTGDIAVMAAILNQLHTDNPALLLSLTPQTANTAATRSFSGQFANYASLIMQTHSILSWVGIQIYNTGCMLGIDTVCYDPNNTASPNFTVAMATDLLVSWPAKTSSGAITGFLPYIGYLTPSQVVVGFPAPNAAGQSDGAPVVPLATIRRSVQCLRTAVPAANSCGTYVPPKAFPGFGGVFNWEVTYDRNNGYAFAKGLTACVLQGSCN